MKHQLGFPHPNQTKGPLRYLDEEYLEGLRKDYMAGLQFLSSVFLIIIGREMFIYPTPMNMWIRRYYNRTNYITSYPIVVSIVILC